MCWSVLFVSTQDNIPDTVIQKIQPYIENEDFQPAAIAKVTFALIDFTGLLVMFIKLQRASDYLQSWT